MIKNNAKLLCNYFLRGDIMNLKVKLLQLNIFEDNDYLDKYVSLIHNNLFTERCKFKTQRHHIIPRCYFKSINGTIDNSSKNLVNLLYKDHIIAHCYLVLASKENLFKYHNRCAIDKLLSHRDFKDMRELVKSLDEVQLAYESAREVNYRYNPMFIDEHREAHSRRCKTNEFRQKVSISLKEYRKNHPFTDEHRKRLSESAMGNHNFGSGDTRSIGCYCIDTNTGDRHNFHSYKEAGQWWHNTYHPFGEKYVECTMQRKIKACIKDGKCYFGTNRDRKVVDDIKWFKSE